MLQDTYGQTDLAQQNMKPLLVVLIIAVSKICILYLQLFLDFSLYSICILQPGEMGPIVKSKRET